jgi:chaperonin GroEL (HSP60 family)
MASSSPATDGIRVSVLAARGIATVVRSSLGPRAMNKMMIDPFGKVM